MKHIFKPTLFISRGEEKEVSARLKKEALNRVLDCDYELLFSEKGKPVVKCDFCTVGISVSHDAGAVAVLVTPFEPVGIDLQRVEAEYPSRVPDRFFTKNERALIKAPRDFYDIWCRKESLVKMTGDGIASLSCADAFSSDFVFTNLSEMVSEILNDEYIFYICAPYETTPEIIIL